ncbi:MAG: hypothetical protein HZC19_01975 [Candidatus Omnitrophica bacterium]|nr:hypothetical protein [Candidatus Omnitrophota bacterium]
MNLKIISRIDEEMERKFSLSIGNKFETDLTSIGILGISMYSKYYLPKGLQIGLEIDGKPFGLEELMNLKGELCYCRQVSHSKYNCGVKFMNIPNRYKKIIADLVERKL